MKHQGIEGFTWDSKAEEWAAWARSCLQHDPPPSPKAKGDLWTIILDYEDEARLERQVHANQWSDPDPYRVISWRDYPPSGVTVWPAVVLLLVAIALFVWFAG